MPPNLVVQAIQAEVHELDRDVMTEELGSLTDAFGFDRDWMDLEHADLGKHAVIAPVFVTDKPSDLIALALTVIAATRLALLPTVVIGVGSAALLRYFMSWRPP